MIKQINFSKIHKHHTTVMSCINKFSTTKQWSTSKKLTKIDENFISSLGSLTYFEFLSRVYIKLATLSKNDSSRKVFNRQFPAKRRICTLNNKRCLFHNRNDSWSLQQRSYTIDMSAKKNKMIIIIIESVTLINYVRSKATNKVFIGFWSTRKFHYFSLSGTIKT